ncbi:hypothetical protein BBBOND_0207030 [Babesia bigemina]|uniref:Uncharacterized protein n=1 Tax=Babesia bigemina TaxID=5866 RepID=A0A061DCG5_BABBI|nr:hypothetical protein BBBOND_0207030 [Babesia bigemina]CDR95545.1 hypothetical protein BBBOND_0207030 [Babesia bigemina]|eukprot:XP_012767731.1 hypothetical protein BBBOND_0207030 [Babesia bigemina]
MDVVKADCDSQSGMKCQKHDESLRYVVGMRWLGNTFGNPQLNKESGPITLEIHRVALDYVVLREPHKHMANQS